MKEVEKKNMIRGHINNENFQHAWWKAVNTDIEHFITRGIRVLPTMRCHSRRVYLMKKGVSK